MKQAAYVPEAVERVLAFRLWWAGPLMVSASLIANALTREIALTLFDIPPSYHHLMWGHLLSVTVVAVGAAVLVFAAVARYARRPIHLYRRIAAVVLMLSLLPDAAMLFGGDPGHTTAGIITLMSMHIVDAAICVVMLTTLTRERGG